MVTEIFLLVMVMFLGPSNLVAVICEKRGLTLLGIQITTPPSAPISYGIDILLQLTLRYFFPSVLPPNCDVISVQACLGINVDRICH